MHMEVKALFGRFVWRGVNIDDATIHPSRGTIVEVSMSELFKFRESPNIETRVSRWRTGRSLPITILWRGLRDQIRVVKLAKHYQQNRIHCEVLYLLIGLIYRPIGCNWSKRQVSYFKMRIFSFRHDIVMLAVLRVFWRPFNFTALFCYHVVASFAWSSAVSTFNRSFYKTSTFLTCFSCMSRELQDIIMHFSKSLFLSNHCYN